MNRRLPEGWAYVATPPKGYRWEFVPASPVTMHESTVPEGYVAPCSASPRGLPDEHAVGNGYCVKEAKTPAVGRSTTLDRPPEIPTTAALLRELSFHAKESARQTGQTGQEIGILIGVDAAGQPVRTWYVNGDEHAVSLPLAEIIEKLQDVGAAGGIVHHTHPHTDGLCQPSAGDGVAMRQIRTALRAAGLELLDYTISGPPHHGFCQGYSARESGDL